MTERPIIFNDEMVRALLAGRKTQTRRVVKPSVKGCTVGVYTHDDSTIIEPVNVQEDGSPWIDIECPHGVPGDRLWVREVFAMQHSLEVGEIKPFNDGRPFVFVDEGVEHGTHWEQPHYRATDPKPDLCYEDQAEEGPHCRWSAPFYLPRWASRILLEIKEVKVERVQDISLKDARAEGGNDDLPHVTANDKFKILWDSINAKKPGRTWEDNPWVWAITFEVVE
jgi:hypothetical protein